MIFGLVGTNSWDFTRLIKELDMIASETDEEVVLQIGNNKIRPKYAEYFNFKSKREIEAFYKRSRVIVAHAGIGILLSAIRYKKPIIIVPRMKKYGEHFDDHQIDTAKQLEKEGITVLWDITKLKSFLINQNLKNYFKKNNDLIYNLKNYIKNYE
ncbi:MAG: hypothetical protein Kow0019_15760 [Methanobacteriaceae archaeon]